jgi:hypothetical protein
MALGKLKGISNRPPYAIRNVAGWAGRHEPHEQGLAWPGLVSHWFLQRGRHQRHRLGPQHGVAAVESQLLQQRAQ